MSLILCVYTKDGFVLSGDSRVILNKVEKNNQTGKEVHLVGTFINDSVKKVFLCPNNVGIAFAGESSIKGEPLEYYINKFINDNINNDTHIDDMPEMILEYFNSLPTVPKSSFYVVGYQKNNLFTEPRFYTLDIANKGIKNMDVTKAGATWNGEGDVLIKLLAPTFSKRGEEIKQLPFYEIPWNLFNTDMAIEFTKYAFNISMETMKFQNRVKSVGGNINILVIKENEAYFTK